MQPLYCHRLYILTTKCYHWPASDISPAGYDRQDLESTRIQSCNLDWAINNWFPEGMHCQEQLAMTLGCRGQLHVSCLFTCFNISSSKFYITLHTFRAYILCKAYDIQSPWKYFPYTLFWTLIRQLPRMVRFKKDVIAWCFTHKSKCVIYLTVGDHCRVFPLHRMNERVDTAVVIWCWTSG